jgi:SpoVK/Ycf46/Vps4 family AAA+-type ATPase
VNALLTQIDQLKHHKNVIVLATSNITGAIGMNYLFSDKLDLAFVDRADIKQYVGPPSVSARYQIMVSSLNELMRVGIISPQANYCIIF